MGVIDEDARDTEALGRVREMFDAGGLRETRVREAFEEMHEALDGVLNDLEGWVEAELIERKGGMIEAIETVKSDGGSFEDAVGAEMDALGAEIARLFEDKREKGLDGGSATA